MDTVTYRKTLYNSISDLKAKPRPTLQDTADLERMQRELRDSLLQIGRPPGGGSK